jgi:hypothetical protein
MATRAQQQPLTIERLERVLVLCAYAIELDGPVHMPAYEAIERELQKMRDRKTVRDRARNLIASHTLDGGRKAIGHHPLEIGLKAKK